MSKASHRIWVLRDPEGYHVFDEVGSARADMRDDVLYIRADRVAAAREEGRQAGLREAAECADKTSTCILPSGHFLSERVGDAIRALSPIDQPTFTPPDETGCQECGGENPVWFAPHDLWNRVMGGEDCKDDPGGIICPICFIRRAERVGIKEIWRVGPVEDNPPRSKGMTVQEAAIVVADWIDSDMITANELISAHVNITQETPVRHWFSQILRALSGDRHE